MPKAGSHAYDIDRARLRKDLGDYSGIPDAEANERANEQLQEDPARRPEPATRKPEGPLGQH